MNWKFVFIKCGGRKNLKTISARNLPALGDLPEELAQCTSLESLDVSGCNFTSLPSMFTNKELARGMKLKVRSIQKCFTHRSVSTLDRVPFQLTGELFLYCMALRRS